MTEELAFRTQEIEDGKLRLSLFQENVRDALISQAGNIPPDTTTLYTFVTNVGMRSAKSRRRSVAGSKDNFFIRHLEEAMVWQHDLCATSRIL